MVLMPHPYTRFAGYKRKLPFIDTEELVTCPEDEYPELGAEPPLHPARRRRISDWAQAYLHGDQIFIASAALRGSFEGTSARSRTRTRRRRARSIAESVEYVKDPLRNETASRTIGSDETGKNGSRQPAEISVSRNAIVNTWASEEIAQSIEENNCDSLRPIAVVQGRPVFPHEAVNNNGETVTISRKVTTWPHELRLGNQIDRLKTTKRPYIQNTPWDREKIIPLSESRPASVTQTSALQKPAESIFKPIEEWIDSSAGVNKDFRSEAIFDPSEHSIDDVEEAPTTPLRQMIQVDSQFPVMAVPSGLLIHQDSCQTAELIDDSQLHPGDVHMRLQDVLHSTPPNLADPEKNSIPPVEKCSSVAISLPMQSPSASRVDKSSNSEQHSESTTTEPLVKLKQLEDAIDHQLSSKIHQSSRIDSTVLVSSSFDGDSNETEVQKTLEEVSQPTGSASTDRIMSSQPGEQTSAIVASTDDQEGYPVSELRSEKTPKKISFEQSSIRKAFQVSKSFERRSQTPAKKSFQSLSRNTNIEVVSAKTPAMTTDLAGNQSPVATQKKSSSAQTHLTRRGILTYGKRKSQASLFSNGRNASFLESIPKSQRELQRAAVETHGYNYDVEDDFDLDGTIDELGSFLSSWDREKMGIGI